jgi:flagella basal body P-ring formation protein FlgA
LLRGVNLAEHRLSGSSQVAILGGEPAPAERERPLASSVLKQASRRVREAVEQYLQQFCRAEDGSVDMRWVVEVELDQERARLAAGSDRRILVTGGAPPWTGKQCFEVTIDTPEGPVQFSLEAQVSAWPEMVVAVRSLPRGAILSVADVALKRDQPSDKSTKGFYSIDDVIGKETTQAIAKEKVLQPEMLRAPLLVRRRDVVTVCARGAGIRVRTVGRACDDGSLGDLVAVESLEDRKRYLARVSGIREVEVYAHPVQAGQTRLGGPSHVVRR